MLLEPWLSLVAPPDYCSICYPACKRVPFQRKSPLLPRLLVHFCSHLCISIWFCHRAILPLLLYSAPVWAEAMRFEYNRVKYIRVQRLMNIKIVKAFHTTSSEALCILTGTTPIIIRTEVAVKKYFLRKEKGALAQSMCVCVCVCVYVCMYVFFFFKNKNFIYIACSITYVILHAGFAFYLQFLFIIVCW